MPRLHLMTAEIEPLRNALTMRQSELDTAIADATAGGKEELSTALTTEQSAVRRLLDKLAKAEAAEEAATAAKA